MPHTLHIKAHLLSSHGATCGIRRFTISIQSSFEDFFDIVSLRFGQARYSIFYTDPDGDKITVGGPEEWLECLRLHHPSNVLTLIIHKWALDTGRDDQLNGEDQRGAEVADCFCAPEGYRAGSTTDLGQQGYDLLVAGEYREAATKLTAACGTAPSAHDLYNLACTHSLMQHKAQALRYLRESVAAGYVDWRHMQSDADLTVLRRERQFVDILNALRDQCVETGPCAEGIDSSPEEPPPPSSLLVPSTGGCGAEALGAAKQCARRGYRYQALRHLRDCRSLGFLSSAILDDDDFAALRTERQFIDLLATLSPR